MPRVWSPTKPGSAQAGFSLVELLLAVVIFGFMVTAMVGALVYGRASTAGGGDRTRALELADEGSEAVRNIRDAAYTNLADGTYGLVQTGGVWTLSGTSDTTGIFTRQVVLASNGVNRKNVTVTVSWPQGAGTSQVSVATELTNWAKTKSWLTPALLGSYDAAGTDDGYKVATVGNYAYIVRQTGSPNFIVVNISNPANPTLVGSLNLTGSANNIAVSGNYAYVASGNDSGELEIVNITTPSAPTLAGSYDAPGTADGLGIAVSGNYAYLTRAANGGNNEFVAINVTTPSAPVRVGYYNLNVNMYEVYVYGGNVYIVTGADNQEVIKITNALLGLITLVTSIDLPGTTDATTISGIGNALFIGQGTAFYTASGTLMTTTGSVTMPGTVNDIDTDSATYAFVGTSYASAEFQVVNITNLAAPAIVGSADIPGTSSNLTGVAYNASLNAVAGASAADTQEAVVFGPN